MPYGASVRPDPGRRSEERSTTAAPARVARSTHAADTPWGSAEKTSAASPSGAASAAMRASPSPVAPPRRDAANASRSDGGPRASPRGTPPGEADGADIAN